MSAIRLLTASLALPFISFVVADNPAEVTVTHWETVIRTETPKVVPRAEYTSTQIIEVEVTEYEETVYGKLQGRNRVILQGLSFLRL